MGLSGSAARPYLFVSPRSEVALMVDLLKAIGVKDVPKTAQPSAVDAARTSVAQASAQAGFSSVN